MTTTAATSTPTLTGASTPADRSSCIGAHRTPRSPLCALRMIRSVIIARPGDTSVRATARLVRSGGNRRERLSVGPVGLRGGGAGGIGLLLVAASRAEKLPGLRRRLVARAHRDLLSQNRIRPRVQPVC